ncbi:MAG: ABC transporter ATP-binding protein [Bacteroidales bacterium]|nr:ABC transporter ATP-binding protein [Bacteroidales bacterium]
MKRLFAVLKPHWKSLALGLFGIVFVSFLDSYFNIIDKNIIDQGILMGDKSALIRLLATYMVVLLLSSAGFFMFIYNASMMGEKLRFELRMKLFKHLQKLSLSYFSKTPLGWIMSRVTSDTERMGELLSWGIIDVSWAITNIIFASVFMFSINARLALIVVLSLPIMIFVAFKFRVKIYHHYRLSRKANSKMTAALNENITGVRVVKALRREDRNLADFKVLSHDMYSNSYRAAFLSAIFLPTIQTISALSLAVVMWRGGVMISSPVVGSLTVGGLQAFISYIMMILWPIQDLARVYAEMQNAVASSERVFGLLETKPAIQDKPVTTPVDSLLGEVVFDNVSFHYEDGEPVIRDLSFSIPAGQNIALVGPTGGGKTTIVNLLCRFYEPTSGTISIAGHNYLDYAQKDIQSRVGVVLQTPHLFSGTVRENLRYGRLSATDDEIEAVARLAGAHEFIMKFEHGYEQNVGEGGNLLSVGQKQLISIARALLADPDFFVMDEATSSVDTITESLIQSGMHQLMEGRTSFIIAHRLSTIRSADQIFVIDHGQIAERGTHEALMKLKGHYYNLYTQQFRHDLESKYDIFGEQASSATAA